MCKNEISYKQKVEELKKNSQASFDKKKEEMLTHVEMKKPSKRAITGNIFKIIPKAVSALKRSSSFKTFKFPVIIQKKIPLIIKNAQTLFTIIF